MHNVTVGLSATLVTLGLILGLVCTQPACGGGGAICGDGVAQGAETCDASDLRGHDCTTLGEGFAGGVLGCGGSCTFDTVGCHLAACGDGLAEGDEPCDGVSLREQTCESLGLGFVGGTLVCSADCTYDVSACLSQGPLCGNDRVEGAEACDGTDLQGHDCVSLAAGFVGGTLDCSLDCAFDVSSCLPPECGDGEANLPEPCDGADLRGNTCMSLGLGFTGGDLACRESCAFDTTGCQRDPVCGNNIAEPGEACDGADLRLTNCVTHGFGGGILDCAADCTLDMTACTGDRCAILNLYSDGVCDACGLSGGTLDPDCSLCSVADGSCGPPDQLDPFVGQSTCLLVTGTKDPDCGLCGDGVASPAEQCDGMDTGETSCRSLGFDHGTLACDADCVLDLSGCEGFCGDGSKDANEFCDGSDLGGMDCATLGLGSGQLACFGNCTYNRLGCTPLPVAVCGDGVAAVYEACDGADLAGESCQNVGFTGGNLFCHTDCTFDFSECTGDLCGLVGWYNNGICDPCQEYGGSLDPDCAACSVTDGQCSPPDIWHPHFSSSTCLLVTGASDPDCGTCGDGTASYIEHCDGNDLKGLSCADLGFSSGILACSASCLLSFAGCQ